MQQTTKLTANNKARVEIAGRHFLILDTGAASSLELWIYRGTDELEYIRTAKRGFKARVPEGFTHLALKSTVDATCEVVISNGVVDFDFISGTSVQATIVGPIPVPVSNDRGSPGNPMSVTAVTVADSPATSSPDNAAVACTAVAAAILAADATRRQIVFTNIGADDVALGAAGITWAKRCIILKSGDSFVEERAANLAWYGICDAAKTASVTTKTVLS
jgi:hypothetical protein